MEYTFQNDYATIKLYITFAILVELDYIINYF